MNFWINISAGLGFIGAVYTIYKRQTIKSKAIIIANDLVNTYNLFNQKPDQIINVQIINKESVTDITSNYTSKPYIFELNDGLLKITYSYNGQEYIIILDEHNSTKFPLYKESELQENDSTNDYFISAYLLDENKNLLKNVTELVKKYAGPKVDFYLEKGIPFKLDYISELPFNSSNYLRLTDMYGNDYDYDLSKGNESFIYTRGSSFF